ncbi:M20/M25/M40 family metallo-hydrolase [Haliea sp. E1-2-M8]|uniref:M20/M25/M40 family metallo-hydrolase n=1 Tax=Haliea sp. E1-2-M8 TaxID=3064706 RepID=UPI00271CA16E|nr:M20/M25/M40 family metallo-hydrolase [Haliea sp. E1-2-M8]MDO8861984.1 M20/M25/M40 family metallo-hydrolase [Haliea sp. E1-2-M8]
MNQRLSRLSLLAAILLVAACAKEQPPVASETVTAAETATVEPARIDAQRLSEQVKVLASDEFGGRAPGTAGESKTVEYLIEQFETIGIEPGGPDGSWTQTVPMIHTLLGDAGSLTITQGGDSSALLQAEDIEVSTVRPATAIVIDEAPVAFVGFGVSAPERDWDDFGDLDLTGKIALFLVNDPDFAAAAEEPVAGRFGNRRMTYYGRWSYKFEEAARRGALGALVIHETEAAGYGWSVASSSPGENYALADADAQPVALQGWMHGDTAARLLAAAGHDLAQLRVAARHPDFEAFELEDTSFSADLQVQVKEIDSANVLGLLPGSTHPDEILMASAHWDSYGEGAPDAEGRTVRPGANDDALGTAGVLELARVLKAGPPLQRSVVFALWTAEESGLLGSKAYADDPVYPLETTVANFTLDILQTAGLARDVILVGKGQSELEDDLARVAATQDRVVTPENLPENGLFYRADHFSMARGGVPVLLLMAIAGGNDLVEGGRAAGNQWVADYVGNCYHQTCDAWDPDWNLAGAVQDIELFQMLIEDLGNSRRWPEWKAGSEFKALRDTSSSARL